MDPATLKTVLDLVHAHAWIAIASLVIGALLRLSKSDAILNVPFIGPLVASIPSNKRSWLAFGLGQFAAVLDTVSRGTAWGDAIVSGLVASALAIMGHDAFIEGARNGKELFSSRSSKRTGGKPPSAGASAGTAVGLAIFVSAFRLAAAACLLGFFLSGCGAGNTVCAGIDLAKMACDTLPIRYLGPNGEPETVVVRKADLVHDMEVRRAAAGGAGGDAGPCDACAAVDGGAQ